LDRPWDDLGQEEQSSPNSFYASIASWFSFSAARGSDDIDGGDDEEFEYSARFGTTSTSRWQKIRAPLAILTAVAAGGGAAYNTTPKTSKPSNEEVEIVRPDFVFEHPYISSSYYTSTKSLKTLQSVDKFQVQPKKAQLAGRKVDGEKDFTRDTQTRLAILRPFCAFDAGPLPTTFDCEYTEQHDCLG
jgi:hypothetical protein